MQITINHAASSYGMPVILDDAGNPMDYAQGIKDVRRRLTLSTQELADKCGVSKRTVEGWEMGRMPTAAALNVMSLLLQQD